MDRVRSAADSHNSWIETSEQAICHPIHQSNFFPALTIEGIREIIP